MEDVGGGLGGGYTTKAARTNEACSVQRVEINNTHFISDHKIKNSNQIRINCLILTMN